MLHIVRIYSKVVRLGAVNQSTFIHVENHFVSLTKPEPKNYFKAMEHQSTQVNLNPQRQHIPQKDPTPVNPS